MTERQSQPNQPVQDVAGVAGGQRRHTAVVTIGNFDGVHRGHQYMLRQVVERAHALGVPSFAITFEPHPQTVLHPERKPTRLLDPAGKVALIRALGIDQVWVCPFTRELSLLAPQQFMEMVAARQPIEELWIGADFALGRNRSGTVAVLAEIGDAHGWALHMVPPFREAGQVVHSTLIRSVVASGDVKEAAELLGRPYAAPGAVSGVEQGRPRFTAAAERAFPPAGVYAAEIDMGTRRRGDADNGGVEQGWGEGVTPPSSGSEGVPPTRVPVVAAVLPPGEVGDEHVALVAPLDASLQLPTRRAGLAFVERLRDLRPGDVVARAASEADLAAARSALSEPLQLGTNLDSR